MPTLQQLPNAKAVPGLVVKREKEELELEIGKGNESEPAASPLSSPSMQALFSGHLVEGCCLGNFNSQVLS